MSERLQQQGRVAPQVLSPATAPLSPPGARLPWPRTPDEVFTASTLTTGNGQTLQPRGCRGPVPGFYIVAGGYTGAQALSAANNWYPIYPGDVLPPGVSVRSDGTFSGSISFRWFYSSDDELEELSRLAQLVRPGGAGQTVATSTLPPNRSNAREVTGIVNVEQNILWAISGFQFATVRNLGPLAVEIGSATGQTNFELPVGGAENNFVGDATGFYVIGPSAVQSCILNIIEYGRS